MYEGVCVTGTSLQRGKAILMKKRTTMRAVCCVSTSIALALSLAATPAGVARADALDSVPEWAVDDGSLKDAAKPVALPASFDMRDRGWVTPVKLQNPWGTCWAFGAIAASESSILSNASLTFDQTNLDLSERHLAWFAMQPVTYAEDPAQAGEGACDLRGGNQKFQTGGPNILVTTLFSQGVGPVTEQEFPYRGTDENGITNTNKPTYPYEAFLENREQGTLEVLAEINSDTGATVESERSFLEALALKYNTSYEQELAEATAYVEGLYASTKVEYSKNDDWSIAPTDAHGASNRFKHAGLIIKDGNVLPEYWDADKSAINDASMTAMKREIYNGHGVVINYRADQAQPGAASDNTYINKKTWAQYTFQSEDPNHAVCIVGWDDNYPASNFVHGVLVADGSGNAIVHPDSERLTTPPGDGAWIVKNSWGSETDAMIDDLGNSIGNGEYGMRDAQGRATGYFYLSYFDLTIQKPETMSFSSNLMGPTGEISIFQHDYMPAQGGFYNVGPTADVMSSANVFDLKEGDHDMVVVSVGGRTTEQNQQVTFALYQLSDGAEDPTDGRLLWRASSDFEYAGYHRLDLDTPLAIRAGHRYSVVSTAFTPSAGGRRSYMVSEIGRAHV